MRKEQYKDTNYFITDTGRVFRGQRELKPYRHSKGYVRIDISQEGKKIVSYVHRMVAETFLPNPKNVCCINHKDGDKKNNNLDNLEWVTNQQNIQHRTEILRVGVNESHSNTKVPTLVVRYLRWANSLNYPVNIQRFASRYDVTTKYIKRLMQGQYRKWVD